MPATIALREPVAETTIYRGGAQLTVRTEFSRVDLSDPENYARSGTVAPLLFETVLIGQAKGSKHQVVLQTFQYPNQAIALDQHVWFMNDGKASGRFFAMLQSGQYATPTGGRRRVGRHAKRGSRSQ